MITSNANKQIKNLTLLVKKAKERKAQGVFVVEGPRMCFEAPESWVEAIYVASHFLAKPENAKALEDYLMAHPAVEERVEEVADHVFDGVSDTKTPQGILAVIRMPHYELQDLIHDNPMLLVLEGVQDPGNLGTMIRTGEGAGITGVLMSANTVDLFNPKTIRSTMGSIYRIPFVVADDFAEAINELKEQGVTLYAAHLKGECSYDAKDYTGACGFMIGNEGNGLTTETADMASDYIRIPMEGEVESLNAAISASILMYECNRQRRNKS